MRQPRDTHCPVCWSRVLRNCLIRSSTLSMPGGACVNTPPGLFTTRHGPSSYKISNPGACMDGEFLRQFPVLIPPRTRPVGERDCRLKVGLPTAGTPARHARGGREAAARSHQSRRRHDERRAIVPCEQLVRCLVVRERLAFRIEGQCRSQSQLRFDALDFEMSQCAIQRVGECFRHRPSSESLSNLFRRRRFSEAIRDVTQVAQRTGQVPLFGVCVEVPRTCGCGTAWRKFAK